MSRTCRHISETAHAKAPRGELSTPQPSCGRVRLGIAVSPRARIRGTASNSPGHGSFLGWRQSVALLDGKVLDVRHWQCRASYYTRLGVDMKRFRLLGVMLVALCVVGLMASSAFALPDVSITLCEPNCGRSYPLHLNYLSNTITSTLETANGGLLHGVGLHVLYLIGELTALGTFRAIFLKVEKLPGGEKCFNQGIEENAEVSTEGSFHIVYTSLAGSSQGLQLGILYLLTEINEAHGNIIQCPKSGIDVEVRGSVIGTINQNGANNNTQLTGLRGVLSGSRGVQSFRAYWADLNLAGPALLAKLESDNGGGFLQSNEIVEGEPEATSLEGKMFVITSR
jgi:hypothetical protein